MARYVYNNGKIDQVDKQGNVISNKVPITNLKRNSNITTTNSKKENTAWDKTGATLGNTLLLLGKGIVDKGEQALDWANDMSAKANSALYKLLGRDDLAKQETESAKNFIKRDLTSELGEKTGASRQITKNEQNGSLLTRDNLGGQVVQAVGGMIPTLLIGKAAGIGELNAALNASKMGTLTKVGTSALINAPTNAMLASSSYGGALEEAYLNGATEAEATKYAIGSTAVEIASEWITGGVPGTNGKGGLDSLTEKGIEKISNKLVKDLTKYGYQMIGEGVEEGIAEIMSPILKNATYSKDEKVDWNNVINSAIIGGITSGIIEAPITINNIMSTRNQSNNINTSNNVLPTARTRNSLSENIESNNNSTDGNLYQYAETNNEKINNLRKSAVETGKFVNNDKTNGVMNVAEKLISDKNYNIVFDDNIKNENGNTVNAQITTLENGETEIRLNPNSERAAEFLLIHEVSHGIKTQEMIDLVNDYASKNPEFNQAVKSLEQLYGKDLTSEEVFADVCGQLFGNQEFIMNLSTSKPSLFRRIYNKIVELANKITGNSNEALFIRDLKNKWENAYRTQNNNLEDTKYMITGLKGVKNGIKVDGDNQWALDSYNKAQEMLNKKYTNEEIRKKTNWFQDKQGKWKFEISDHNAILSNDIKKNTNCKLSDIFNHSELYEMYPKLKKIRIKFKNISNYNNEQVSGQYVPLTNTIEINNKMLEKNNANLVIKKTLLHEIQHYIQKIEHFDKGYTGNKTGEYFENIGEIEASNTANRVTLNEVERMINAPETSKEIPIHPTIQKILENPNSKQSQRLLENQDIANLVNKIYNEIGESNEKTNINNKKTNIKSNLVSKERQSINDRIGRKREIKYEIAETNNLDDTKSLENQTRHDSGILRLQRGRGELDNSSFSYDNQGRELSKKQQEYFKDSKVRDENGNLKVYYNGSGNHTEYLPGYMSDESIWGKGIYLTPYKDIASGYGNDVKETYVNITKPISHNTKMSFEQYNEFYKAVYDGEEAYIEEYDMYDNDFDLLWDSTNKGNWADYANELKKYTGYDGIIAEEIDGDRTSSMVIAFQSNQIKNVDNTDPTSNNDIRYSQEGNEWQEHLEKNYKATGTRTKFNDMQTNNVEQSDNNSNTKNQTKKIMNPLEISKFTKEDANTTPILKKINVSTGDGESKFASNIRNKTDMLSESSKDTILSNDDVRFYEKVTNKESLDKAFERLNKNGKSETETWLRKESENATSVDVAEGWILLKQYQDNIAKETDINTKNELNRSMVEVAKKLREMGTKAGQTVQAFNILNRLTPEGMVYYAQSELSEAYEKMSQNKTKEWIDSNRDRFELTPEETQFIMDTMNEVQQMEDGYDKRVKLAEIQKVMTDKLPPERGAGIKSWMRISMLFNPKTQVRNVMGNAIIAPVNSFSDLFASYVDKQIAKKTGIRTTGKTNLNKYKEGFKTGLYQSYNDFKKGINTRDMQGNRFEVTQGKSFNDNSTIGKKLNQVDSLLSFMLDAGDRGFYEAAFTNSINNQMILNNTTKVTQDMIDIATSEALSRTWQDNNNYTKFVLQTRNALNKINIKGYGLGDILIPFAKTPANLTKAIIDYSPVGMINAINSGRNLKNSLSNGQYNAKLQHQFVQNLGKATAGTLLYVLGYALAEAGITSGESDEDKDVKDFMKNTLGISSYSIKIGNKTFTYDWAQPIAAPLSIMANIVKNQKEGATLTENIISSLDTAGNILLEQSFMESINTVLNNNEGIVSGIQEAILELPSRAVPTLMKQIVDLTDDTQRTTFEYNKPLQTAVNKVKAKIPGLSKTLSPVVDTMGREVQRYGGKNNIFNVFLNPANVNTENISESAQEIYRVYKSTGDKTIMPRVIPYYFDEKGTKRTLNAKERSEFQKISGQIIEQNVAELINNINYANLSDIDKSAVLNNLVNYAYNKARYEMFGTEMSNQYNKVNEWTSQGGSVSDYYANKEENDYSLENSKKYNTMTAFNLSYSDYNKYSQEINDIKEQYNDTNSRKYAVWQYIQNQNLTKVQKILLYHLSGGYSISNYQDYLFNYLNNQNITKKEKQEIWNYLYK